jgi:hypothetical protein
MRKTITHSVSKDTAHSNESWLDLERLAQVEVTSEEAANPVESALDSRPWGRLAGRATRRAEYPAYF